MLADDAATFSDNELRDRLLAPAKRARLAQRPLAVTADSATGSPSSVRIPEASSCTAKLRPRPAVAIIRETVPLGAALEVGHSQTSSPAGALTQRSQSLPKLPVSHPRCIIREHWDLVEDATQPTDLLDSRTKIKQGTGQLLVPPRIHRPRLIRLPRGAKLPDYGGLPGRSRAMSHDRSIHGIPPSIYTMTENRLLL
jgi:hypothetical protein